MRIQADHQEKDRLVIQSDARDWISASAHPQPELLVTRIEYQKVACGTVVSLPHIGTLDGNLE